MAKALNDRQIWAKKQIFCQSVVPRFEEHFQCYAMLPSRSPPLFSLLQGMKKLGILKRLVRWSKFQHEATKETKEETYKHGLYRGTSLHSIAWKIHANHLMTLWEHKLFFVFYFELFAFCDAFFCGISWMASSFWVGSNLKRLTALIASLVSLACVKRKLRTNELSKQVKCGDTLGFTRSIHLPVILWKQFCSRAV